MTETTPWNEGDKATIMHWWEEWQKQEKKPESINITATHFVRLLEGAVHEIQREI